MATSATSSAPVAHDPGRRILARLIPSTLGTRLALTYTGLTLLIVAVVGWVLAETIRDFSLAQLRATLAAEAIVAGDLLAPALAPGGNATDVTAVTAHLAEALDARITVIGSDGTVLADSAHDPATMENHLGRPEVQEASRTGLGSSIRPSSTLGAPYLYVARPLEGGQGFVRLALSLEVVDSLVGSVQRRIVAAAVVAAILMTGAGWFVARRIAQGLTDIQRQAAAVAAGRLDVAVEPAQTKELGDLGRTFNAMTVRLRETVTELERVRSRLEATLADLSDGVVITDRRGHVMLANDAALAMLAVDALVGDVPFVEVARDHELAELAREILDERVGAADRVIQHGRSGRILQTAARRLDAAGERIGVIVLRDITELRRLEGMRREFVANVSHELRTPLASIRVLVETLEAGALHDPSVSSDFMARIVSEVDRLSSLVDELLDLARLESGRVRLSLARVDVESMMRQAVERMTPQTAAAGLATSITANSDLPPVVADQDRIDQVLINLIHNAVKFTPSGGRITLRATKVGDVVEVRVADTGVGVSPADLPRLFERFYKVDPSRHSQGTGLGLAIAKHIVQAHGGSIWAEPNGTQGTVFAFTLPIAGPPPPEPAVEDGAREALASGAP